MEKRTERADRLPLAAQHEHILKKVREAKSLTAAASIVATHPLETALSIIDNLDPLTATFVIEAFHERARGRLYPALACRETWARELIVKADELRIRGTLGFCHARDQVYRETGYFAD